MAVQISYGSWTPITFTLAGLASDSNLLIGRSSANVNHGALQTIDAMVGGTVTKAAAGNSAGILQMWAYGSMGSTPDYTAGLSGNDAAATLSAEIKRLLIPVFSITTEATNGTIFNWGPYSVSSIFRGQMPERWGLWVVHSMGAAMLTGTARYQTVSYADA